jgi:hypothetical protein
MPKNKSNSRSKASKSKGSVLHRVQNFSLTQLLIFVLIFGVIGGYVIYRGLAASHSTGITWNPYFRNILSPLDGQGSPTAPVYNTTGCAWNDEDDMENLGRGDLSGSTNDTICLVADYDDTRGIGSAYPKLIIFKVYAPSDTLDVSLSNDVGNSWHSPPSIPSTNLRLWQLCVADPVADSANVGLSNLSYWPEIAGTNGGRGQIVNYTLHITSLKGTTHKVAAYYDIGTNGPGVVPDINKSSPVPCPPQDGA